MPFRNLPQDTSTLLFKLPHISNLFVFKDNFTNHHGMVRIVTEILRLGQLEMIYMGDIEGKSFNYDEYLNGCTDCAIIRVNILDTTIPYRNLDSMRTLFVEALENEANAIEVDPNVINEKKNASTVDLVIAPSRRTRISNPRVQAA